MAAVFAKIEAARFVVRREVRGAEEQIRLRRGLIALPETELIVDDVDSGGAFGDLVRVDQFGELLANAIGLEGEGKANADGVFLQADPMAFVGERFAAENAQGGEDAPAAEQAGLSGREAHLLEGKQSAVMYELAMNHGLGVQWSGAASARAFGGASRSVPRPALGG